MNWEKNLCNNYVCIKLNTKRINNDVVKGLVVYIDDELGKIYITTMYV